MYYDQLLYILATSQQSKYIFLLILFIEIIIFIIFLLILIIHIKYNKFSLNSGTINPRTKNIKFPLIICILMLISFISCIIILNKSNEKQKDIAKTEPIIINSIKKIDNEIKAEDINYYSLTTWDNQHFNLKSSQLLNKNDYIYYKKVGDQIIFDDKNVKYNAFDKNEKNKIRVDELRDIFNQEFNYIGNEGKRVYLVSKNKHDNKQVLKDDITRYFKPKNDKNTLNTNKSILMFNDTEDNKENFIDEYSMYNNKDNYFIIKLVNKE